MTKQKATKRALLMSFLSILLCVSMLIGTTYAWFTDSVTSAGNIIKSGTLEVEMHWAEGEKDVPAEDSADWKDASTTKIFDYDKWEPGYVAVRHIKIANEGTLALKYQLKIIADGEVSELADVIDVYFVDPATKVADRTALTDANKVDTLTNVLKGMPANMSGELLEDEYATVTIALKMQEEAGNEYQDKSIGATFAVQLLATQLTAEKDSFDDQYDKGAWHPDFTVTSVEELAAALASGGNIQVNGTLNAGATQDVPDWTNAPAEFIFDATTLDALKGGKYVLEQGSKYGVVGRISAGESLALSDMEITANSQWPVYLSNYGGTLTLEDIDVTATQGAGIYPYGTNGTTTIKSANVNQKALSDEFAASTPWAGTAIATSNGHNLIIEDGTYIGSNQGVYIYNSGAVVTINGGTFKAPQVLKADGSYSDQTIRGEFVVNGGNFDGQINMTNGYAYCTINGGNFTNFSVSSYSPVVIKGGTFDADPSAYVANGYQAADNGDGTYTVVEGVAVKDAAGLQAAIENATAGDTISLVNDVTVSDALTMNKSFTLNLNGKTLYMSTTDDSKISSAANVIIKNGNVDISGVNFTEHNGIFNITGGAANTLTVENVNFYGDGFTSYSVFWIAKASSGINTLNLIDSKFELKNEAYASGGFIKHPSGGENCSAINITKSVLDFENVTRLFLYGAYNIKESEISFVDTTGEANGLRQGQFTIDNSKITISGGDKGISPRYADTVIKNGSVVTINNTKGNDVIFEYDFDVVVDSSSTFTYGTTSGTAGGQVIDN